MGGILTLGMDSNRIVNPTLDNIITFSCGIGKSLPEAENALFAAKEYRKNNTEGNRLEHNIFIYGGNKIPDEIPENPKVNDYEVVRRFCVEKKRTEDIIESLRNLTINPATGLFNSLGYQIERKKLADIGLEKGYVLIFDGNGMHEANENLGYDNVTKLLGASGIAILQITRGGEDRRITNTTRANTTYDRRKEDRRHYQKFNESFNDIVCGKIPIVGSRIHDDAGDEFVLFIPDIHSQIQQPSLDLLARRIQNKMYENQKAVLALADLYKS